MNKDPKRVLESLRIEEEDPLLNHRPRRFRQRKNELNQVSSTAILSLCLVTGLSTGMGSAFANTLDEKATDHIPLDEPPSKVQLDTNVELPQLQSSQTNSDELTPSKPPLDEPAATNIPKQPSKEPDKSKEEDQSKEAHNQTKKPTTNQTNIPSKKTNKEPEEHPSTASKHQKQDPVKSHKVPAKHTMEEKNNKTKTQENLPKNEEPYNPKTENGGALPHTAGNDLNNAVAGVGVALAGSLLLKRKRAKA